MGVIVQAYSSAYVAAVRARARRLRSGRAALLAACALAARPAQVAAAEASLETAALDLGSHPEPEEILITGQRASRTPATSAGVDAERLEETTAVINAEDSLRYLPSLLVRKRHVGDTQSPLATRTSGVGASARSLIYADGVPLSALIGNNNSTASPRWGMVSAEEIERVDVLYGPFSAAYPGNSIGAVVNITTRMPKQFEASAKAGISVQRFSQYATRGTFPAYQLAGTAGDRIGRLGWFASASHVDSRSHPLAYVTVARPATTSAAGTPVSGAFPDRNRTGAPIFVIGAAGLESQRQDSAKLKLVLDVTDEIQIAYRVGVFLNDTAASAQSYLSGNRYSGALNIDGSLVNVPASAFSNNVYRLDERHWMHALSLDGKAGAFSWRAIGSHYEFDKSEQRIPSGALPGALGGGAGSILRLDGTGWRTFDLEARRGGLSFGAHYDRYRLATRRNATADWLAGPAGALTQEARGRTRALAVWAQQEIGLASELELTLGARYEWWRAYGGYNFSLAPALSVEQPELDREALSPKATLAWRFAHHWSAKLSAGQAYRFPTVQELYQAISTGPALSVPDPNLRPERARSAELALERSGRSGNVRLSLFHERIKDALISQSAPLVPGSPTLFNFVQNVPAVRTRGIELAFERRGLLVPSLDLSGSVTLADPTVLRDPAFPAAEGKDLPQVPRRRATLVATWHPSDEIALTLAGRHSSRSYGTIDNSDILTHTYQGFEGYTVIDARANFEVGERWRIAFGVENLGNDKYYLFHPFPQRSFTAEVGFRW